MRDEMVLSCGTVVQYNDKTDDFRVETPNGTFIFTLNNNKLSVFSTDARMVVVVENNEDKAVTVCKIPNTNFTQEDILIISLEPDDES